MNLREHIATEGLNKSIGGNFGMDVSLKYADGQTQTGLRAQVLYDREAIDPDTGEEIVIKETRITLIKANLDQEIKAGDNVYIEYPGNPSDQSIMLNEVMNADKAPIDGGSIGYITIFPKTTEQI